MVTEVKITESVTGILNNNNWTTWSRNCCRQLRSQGCWDYIEGAFENEPTSPTELLNWQVINGCIVGALCNVVADDLAIDIEQMTSAKKAWEHLKSKAHHDGKIAKFNASQASFQTFFVSPATIPETITTLKASNRTIFEDGPPTKEENLVNLLLHAMTKSEAFTTLRETLLSFITNSSTKLSSADIISRLEHMEREHRQRESLSAQETAFAMNTKKGKGKDKSKPKCSNCNVKGHTIENCWEKGGGSAGKAVAGGKQRRHAKQRTPE